MWVEVYVLGTPKGARHQERLPAATLGVQESYYYLQEPNKGKTTTDWHRPNADMIKDRHLHCGLSQHLLSPQEMLAGAYLLPQLFGLKKDVFDRR